MDNRIYYGEYSLRHWIELILRKNVVLPEYQRFFVWNQKKVKTLIDTLRNKEFVPPVTIGAYKDGESTQNLILDGQQRLTSILLVHIGLFPDKGTYKNALERERFANDNDDIDEDEEEQLDNILEWNFKQLIEKGNNKSAILNNVTPGNYQQFDLEIDDDFLENTFLGFSYLVPHTPDAKTQQKYYSSVFRNINIQGEALLPQESRESLYFLDRDLTQFFTPNLSVKLTVKGLSTETKADFVRYLSLLSHYYEDGKANRVARGYKPKMEKYYEEYIYAVISDEDSEKYGKFSEIFPDKKYEDRFVKLNEYLVALDIPKTFTSIIDLDMYIFGLIYITILKDETLDTSKADELKNDIERKIEEFKEDYYHKKAPNNLGNLRSRISDSIDIYEKHTS